MITLKTPKTLFLAWQDSNSRSWFSIGRLTFDGTTYQFVYTQGAKTAQKECDFTPLIAFPSLDKVYTSTYLFSVFSNRLMSRSRPDCSTFIQWLNIYQNEDDPITILARSGGERETDALAVFPYPEPDREGLLQIHFFSHGLRHLPQGAIERIDRFEPGDKLWLAHEFQNTFNSQGLTLNTEERYIVGCCPQYLNSGIFELLHRDPSLVEVRVERVNRSPTPLQFRLLCNLTARSSDENRLFSSPEYQPLIADAVISS